MSQSTNTLSPAVTVFLSILAAGFLMACAAAMHRVYSARRAQGDSESMISPFSEEQAAYMREVRMRTQVQNWGWAPAFERGD